MNDMTTPSPLSGTDCSTDPRLAGQVSRYHAWPMQQPGTVASHSWQVARLLLMLDPECRKELLIQAVLHDIGENGSADIPFGVKQNSPLLAKEIDRLEREAHLGMTIPWGVPAPQAITQEERWILKLADVLEMWEHGVQEVAQGNTLARLVVTRCENFLMQSVRAKDGPVRDNMLRYMRRRMKEWQA